MTQKTTIRVLLSGLVIVMISALWVYMTRSTDTRIDPEAGIVLLNQERPLPPVPLIDQSGQTVRLDRLQGQWHLLFLGYTYCPDICPVTLIQLKTIYNGLPKWVQEQLDVIFVSVDPERDTPDRIGQYLDFFHERFWGMTGTPENLQAFSKAVNIPYIPPDTSQPGYSIDHSGNLAIIGPDGTLRGFVRAPLNIPKLIENLPFIFPPRP